VPGCLTLPAVGSYPAFSPLPDLRPAVCFLWHFLSGKLSPGRPACIQIDLRRPGYAAPRSVESGLSSTNRGLATPPRCDPPLFRSATTLGAYPVGATGIFGPAGR